MNIRPPAVAGQFYQNDPVQLNQQITQWLDNSLNTPHRVRALIVPHAGYPFSGQTAAQAYSFIRQQRDTIRRVLLVGPSHHYYFAGCAIPQCQQFNTPLGNIPIDQTVLSSLQSHPNITCSDYFHQTEHSLEVQLPFLQSCLNPGFLLLPLLTGHISASDLAEIIDELWLEDTLLVVSSDLSHFHTYADAQRIDALTCDKIDHYQASLSPQEACGCIGVNALLQLAEQHHYPFHQLQRINSGDASGSKSRVVGYVSYVITNA